MTQRAEPRYIEDIVWDGAALSHHAAQIRRRLDQLRRGERIMVDGVDRTYGFRTVLRGIVRDLGARTAREILKWP